MIMTTLRQQIIKQKQNKTENLKDLFYVDYCNNCKNAEIRGTYGKDYTPCNHEWYCFNDGGEVQELESNIAKINHDVWLRGYMCAYEREELKELKNRKWELIKKNRRKLPRIKHGKRVR